MNDPTALSAETWQKDAALEEADGVRKNGDITELRRSNIGEFFGFNNLIHDLAVLSFAICP